MPEYLYIYICIYIYNFGVYHRAGDELYTIEMNDKIRENKKKKLPLA